MRSCTQKAQAAGETGHEVLTLPIGPQPQSGKGLLVRQAGWGSGEQATAGIVTPAEREVEPQSLKTTVACDEDWWHFDCC